MTPTIQPGMNLQLMPPRTMPEGRTCEPLMAYREGHRMVSVWKPDAEELAALNAGGCVALTVLGTDHPPVSVDVVPDNR